jgi:hypothetical protein
VVAFPSGWQCVALLGVEFAKWDVIFQASNLQHEQGATERGLAADGLVVAARATLDAP